MSFSRPVVQVDPPTELLFIGPFTDKVCSPLRLFNPSDVRVIFKIKATTPRNYSARPRNGFIEPGATVQVKVILRKYDPVLRNKLMVVTTIAPDGDYDLDTIWRTIPPEDLVYHRLRGVFEMPDDDKPYDTPMIIDEYGNVRPRLRELPFEMLHIIPRPIRLEGPFTTKVTSYFTLFNYNDKTMVFKWRTSAPNKFVMSATVDFMEPQSSMKVSVSVEPFEFDPTERNEYLCIIEAAVAPDDERNMETVWMKILPRDIVIAKFKLIFEIPEYHAVNTEEVEQCLVAAPPLMWMEYFESMQTGAPFPTAPEAPYGILHDYHPWMNVPSREIDDDQELNDRLYGGESQGFQGVDFMIALIITGIVILVIKYFWEHRFPV